jgi:hypothetical protein
LHIFLTKENKIGVSLLLEKFLLDTQYDYRNWTKTRSWCIRSY